MRIISKLSKLAISAITGLSVISPVLAAPPSYTNYKARKAVQHVFFKDHFKSNKLNAHLVKVDLKNPVVTIDLALAYNNTNRKEKVSHMAERVGAVAAINGSFFHSRNSIHSAVGLLMADGMVLADSGHRRTSLGITEDKKVFIGIPKVKNVIIMPELGVNLKLNGINQVRGKKHITLYNRYFGSTTRTKGAGREILVNQDGTIIGYKMNNAPIPYGGFVISISGANSTVADTYPVGTQVYLDSIAPPPWNQVKTLITGSPQLLKNGKIYNTYFKEKLQHSITTPTTRSAVGINHKNELLLLTVSGKLTLTKLAQIMKRLGAKDALALDGGGSTDLYVKGRTVVSSERPVTNALVVKINPG